MFAKVINLYIFKIYTLIFFTSIVPDHDRLFFTNFVNAINSSDQESLTSSRTPKLLKENATLERAMRLYSRTFSQQRILVGPGIFQTSIAINGVYLCRSENDFGTRSASVNITVKGLNKLHVLACY